MTLTTSEAVVTTSVFFWAMETTTTRSLKAYLEKPCQVMNWAYGRVQTRIENNTAEEKEIRLAYNQWYTFRMISELLEGLTKDLPAVMQKMLMRITNSERRIYMENKSTKHTYLKKLEPFMNLKYGDDKELISSFTFSAYEYISILSSILEQAYTEELRRDYENAYLEEYSADGPRNFHAMRCNLEFILKLQGKQVTSEMKDKIMNVKLSRTISTFNRLVRNYLLVKDMKEQIDIYHNIVKNLSPGDLPEFEDYDEKYKNPSNGPGKIKAPSKDLGNGLEKRFDFPGIYNDEEESYSY